MESSRRIRVLGVGLVIIGLFLIGIMSALTVNLAPMILQPRSESPGSSFTGSPEQGQVILGLFGLLLAFGFGSLVTGIWQVATGRRNKWLAIAMFGLFAILVVVAWTIRRLLGTA